MPEYTYEEALNDTIKKWTANAEANDINAYKITYPHMLKFRGACGLCQFHRPPDTRGRDCSKCILKDCEGLGSLYRLADRASQTRNLGMVSHCAWKIVNLAKEELKRITPKDLSYTFEASKDNEPSIERIEDEVLKDNPEALGFFVQVNGTTNVHYYTDFTKKATKHSPHKNFSLTNFSPSKKTRYRKVSLNENFETIIKGYKTLAFNMKFSRTKTKVTITPML